jgi:hypothetical protein
MRAQHAHGYVDVLLSLWLAALPGNTIEAGPRVSNMLV